MTRKGMAGWVAAAALAVGVGAGIGLAAPADGKWIHIRVVDGDDRQTNVKVNMPVSALISMADAIQDEHFKGGHVRIGEDGIDAAKLRDAWQSVRNARDMDFITVESDDETVKVAKSGRFMIARVTTQSSVGRSSFARVVRPATWMKSGPCRSGSNQR